MSVKRTNSGLRYAAIAAALVASAIAVQAWDAPQQQDAEAMQQQYQQQQQQQQQRMQPPADAMQQQHTPPTPQISEADLATAAAIYNRLTDMNRELQQELEGESDQAVIQERVAETESAMHEVVLDEGMAVEDYNNIMMQVQRNPTLQQRIQQHLH